MKRVAGRAVLAAFLAFWLLASIGLPGTAQATPRTQGGELLTNPGFEEPFYEFTIPKIGQGFVAHGWEPWWVNQDDDLLDTPEYKNASLEIDPFRVHAGGSAQQYFRPWAPHIAGLYQRVRVPANSRVRFVVWGMGWSTFSDPPLDPHNSASGEGSNFLFLQAGIDPKGGENPLSSDVRWSGVKVPMDFYDRFVVDVQAAGEYVTVFTRSTPQYPAPTIDVYWDSASLTVIPDNAPSLATLTPPVPGSGTAVASAPDDYVPPAAVLDETPESGAVASGAPVSSEPSDSSSPAQPNTGQSALDSLEGVLPLPAQDPEPDGSQWHVVRYGDTLLRIAKTYGVPPQQIRDLNSLASDAIFVDQRLLIIDVVAATATPDLESVPTEAADATSAAELSGTGQICLALFNDQDGNGLWQQGEGLLPGGALSISGGASRTHLTDAINEPFCFADLPAGDYVVFAEPPEGYRTTSIGEIPVTLSDGGQVALSFGAVDEEAVPLPIEQEGAEASGMVPLTIGVIIGAGALGLAIVLATAAAIIIVSRQKGVSTAEEEDRPATGDVADIPAEAAAAGTKPDDDGWISPQV